MYAMNSTRPDFVYLVNLVDLQVIQVWIIRRLKGYSSICGTP